MRTLVGFLVLFLALSCSSIQDKSDEINLGGIELGGYIFADTVLGEMSWDDALLSCDTFSAKGYYDWYLPELHPVKQAYELNRNPDFSEYFGRIPDNFLEHIYWTSTEDGGKRICFDFFLGVKRSQERNGQYQVWPVRKALRLRQGDKVLSIEHCLDTLLPIVDNPGVFYSANSDLPVNHEWHGTELNGRQFVARQIVQTEFGSFIQGRFYPIEFNPLGYRLYQIFNRTELDYFFILPNEWHKASIPSTMLVTSNDCEIKADDLNYMDNGYGRHPFMTPQRDLSLEQYRIFSASHIDSLHQEYEFKTESFYEIMFFPKKEFWCGSALWYVGDVYNGDSILVTENCFITSDDPWIQYENWPLDVT